MNILITRDDKIGDFVLALPMMKIAKDFFKDDKIIVLVSETNYEFAKSINFIDDVILYKDNLFDLVQLIKSKKIDISFSAFTHTKLAFALLLAGIKKRYAPASKIAQIFSNFSVTQRRSKVEKTEYEYNIFLLKAYDNNISLNFTKPILNFTKDETKQQLEIFKTKYQIKKKYKYIVFHSGCGGSSDGNLLLDDYIKLAKSISLQKGIKIIFTFGPDDFKNKEYIKNKLDFDAILYDSKLSLIDFCKLLSNFDLFISTSTGPMHLAGAVNIKTISFFGNSLFASSKRWATINLKENQNNFNIPDNYDEAFYKKIENKLKNLIE